MKIVLLRLGVALEVIVFKVKLVTLEVKYLMTIVPSVTNVYHVVAQKKDVLRLNSVLINVKKTLIVQLSVAHKVFAHY